MDAGHHYVWPSGLCVLLKHGLVIASRSSLVACVLHVFSLTDGSLLRTLDNGTGSDKGQFSFQVGGLCATPSGDGVLVAEARNSRVQEVNVLGRSPMWVRFVGMGVLKSPQHVDCNTDVIVVAESSIHRISLFTWLTGTPRARICPVGPGTLAHPSGVRLLRNGLHVAVADSFHHRICVFELDGELAHYFSVSRRGRWPFDVLECDVNDGLIVASISPDPVVKYDRLNGAAMPLHATISGMNGKPCKDLDAAASLPDGGLVLLETSGIMQTTIHVHVGLRLRIAWLTLSCLSKCCAV